MSSNNRSDSDDRPGNEMDMQTDRRDERAVHERRDTHTDAGRHDERIHAEDHDERTDPERRDEHVDHDPNPDERGKWLSALIAILGVWMIVQALMIELTAAQFWNDILIGALLIGVGGYNYSRQANERFANTAVALIAVAAGLWLIAAPFVLGADSGLTETTNEFGFYNDIVVGLLAMGLGAYSAYQTRDHQADTRRANA